MCCTTSTGTLRWPLRPLSKVWSTGGPPVEAPMAMISKGPEAGRHEGAGGGIGTRPLARPAPHHLDLRHQLHRLDEARGVEFVIGMADPGRFFQQADGPGLDDVEGLADIGGIRAGGDDEDGQRRCAP